MSVEEHVDALFSLRPQEFTQARDALVRRLRAAGDDDSATRTKKLRRPTVAAWVLNQLARQGPVDLRRLRAAGDGLTRAQRRALSGLDPGGLRAAQKERMDITRQLLDRAEELLRDAGVAPDPHIDAVRGGLDAVALDAEAGAAVLEGRLSRPLEPPSGFGSLTGLAPVPEGRPAGLGHRRTSRRLDEANAASEAAQAEARSRQERADAAVKEAQQTADEVASLERELGQARRRHATASARAEAACQRAAAAEATVEQRQKDVADAQAAMGAGATT